MTEPLPEIVSPKSLTAALRESGAPGGPRVQRVTADSTRTTIVSRIIRLHLAYDGDAPNAPRSVILKLPHPDRVRPDWTNGRQEVAFYREVAPHSPPGLVPRCFDAKWDAATGNWHLLLEDLTETHAVSAPWPLPPSAEDCARIVAARARFQAAWWDDARLGVSVGSGHAWLRQSCASDLVDWHGAAHA